MPVSFKSSSLTSLGTIGTLNVGGLLNVSDAGLLKNNLTISGTLQSPKTDLLSVSSSVLDGKIGTIVGVSIPQFLTRNETIIPSSFLVWEMIIQQINI